MPIDQADDQIAEAELVMDEQRDDRQRQPDAEIAAEQRRDNARRGTGKVRRCDRPTDCLQLLTSADMTGSIHFG